MEDLGVQLGSLDDDMLGLLHQFMRTCTGNARDEWERLCATNGIHFDETGSAIGTEGQTVDVPTPEFVDALQREAVDFDRIKLGRSTLGVWKDKLSTVRMMERQADAFCERKLLIRAFTHWRAILQRKIRQQQRLERKMEEFEQWKDAIVISICLRRWVIRHREISLRTLQRRQAALQVMQRWRGKTVELQRKEQQAEDARDFYAASNIFKLWRDKAADMKARRRFKHFYLMAKYGRALIQSFRARKKARIEVELSQRYHQFVREKDEKVKRKTLETWHAKAVQIREDEITANERYEHKLDQKAKTRAHNALTKMYDQTVDNQENQEIADAQYQSHLIERLDILGPDSKWRMQTREAKDKEQRAEEYRGIKVDEKAQSAFRNMRNTAARNRQMVVMAEEWRDKQDKKKALGFLGVWRQKAAERRGNAVRLEPSLPQTPAAKKSALMR